MKGIPLEDVARHVAAGLRSGGTGKLAAAQMLESALTQKAEGEQAPMDRRVALRLAVEFGHRCAEQGMNLQAALAKWDAL